MLGRDPSVKIKEPCAIFIVIEPPLALSFSNKLTADLFGTSCMTRIACGHPGSAFKVFTIAFEVVSIAFKEAVISFEVQLTLREGVA